MLTKTILVLGTATLLAACLDTETPAGGLPAPLGKKAVVENAQIADVPADQPRTVIHSLERTVEVCDMLPTDGPCSLACDTTALLQTYVQPGTCESFFCTLADGQTFITGGCR